MNRKSLAEVRGVPQLRSAYITTILRSLLSERDYVSPLTLDEWEECIKKLRARAANETN